MKRWSQTDEVKENHRKVGSPTLLLKTQTLLTGSKSSKTDITGFLLNSSINLMVLFFFKIFGQFKLYNVYVNKCTSISKDYLWGMSVIKDFRLSSPKLSMIPALMKHYEKKSVMKQFLRKSSFCLFRFSL